MNDILVWHCSPHEAGVTDSMAKIFIRGASETGIVVETIYLREYAIRPCSGCNACFFPPHACILDGPQDSASWLFSKLAGARLNIFASPVYFYALPAHFKAWIDRGQKYWNIHQSMPAATLPVPKPAIALMAAGRQKGNLLFNGGLRTLIWFLKLFNFRLDEKILFRGLNNVEDLNYNSAFGKTLYEAGKKWGRLFTAKE